MTVLEEGIEYFVSAHLPAHPKIVRADKIITDSVWGTVRLRKHEVALLDTPLMQRLRRIHQTSFAYLTYPSAMHTRFEHSLGCLHLASQYIGELQEKDKARNGRLIQDDVEDHIRVAALLHDVGHGPFSHSSEEVYGSLPGMADLQRPAQPYEGVRPHEALSCLIVRSAAFKQFLNAVNQDYNVRLDADRIARAIEGKSPPYEQFESDILNGPFDVDKVDYILRDGRLMGLPTAVDLHRLFASMDIAIDSTTGARQLVVELKGEITLEQLIFGKMVLFNSVYRHHKARACDCVLKGIFEYAKRQDITFSGRDMSSPADFLWWTDDLVANEGFLYKDTHPILHDLLHGIAFRRVPKRSLAVSIDFLENPDAPRALEFLNLRMNKEEQLHEQRRLAGLIHQEAALDCPLEFVWVDLPKPPSFNEGKDVQVKKPSGELCPLNDFFGTDQWAEHFDQHKWCGHVFAPEEHIEKISKAARNVIHDLYGIEFKPIAWEVCHLDD